MKVLPLYQNPCCPGDLQSTFYWNMDPQNLEAFTQFLRMSDQNRKPQSFFETFKVKATISAGIFTLAIVAFENFGFALE